MGIYIKGMEIPTAEQGVRTINIYADGVVTNYAEVTIGTAVPVPEHWRLIDADALKEILKPVKSIRDYEPEWTWGELYESTCKAIDSLPTIIPADKEEQT